MGEIPAHKVKIFFSYARDDEDMCNELHMHLGALKNEGIIEAWYDRQITPGMEWNEQIDHHLNSADLILLLVSKSFLNSEYCYREEMKRAIVRHNAGQARVIPIVLRPCHWKPAPFANLQGLPRDMKPITTWDDRDEAFAQVAEGIHRAIAELTELQARATERLAAEARAHPPNQKDLDSREVEPHPELEVQAQLLAYNAAIAHAWLEPKLRMSAAARSAYAFKHRLKPWYQIVAKVVRMRRSSNPDYNVSDITDASGFRVVALFREDIPDILQRILDVINYQGDLGEEVRFYKDPVRAIYLYPYHNGDDPSSIMGEMPRVIKESRLDRKAETVQDSRLWASCSAVDIVVEVEVGSGHGRVPCPAEIQVCSVFEDAWRVISHRCGPYKAVSKDEQEEWVAHLRALGAIVDGCVQHADLINRKAKRLAE